MNYVEWLLIFIALLVYVLVMYQFLNLIMDWWDSLRPAGIDDYCKWIDCPLAAKAHHRWEHGSWLPDKQ